MKPVGLLQVALPDYQNVPPMSRKFSPLPSVTAFVRFDFGLPILLTRLRKTAIAAPVAMPEATVNENHLVAGWEDQVRFAGQIGSVKRVPVAHTVHHSADAHLGASVLGSDTGHDSRAHCRGDSIQFSPPANIVNMWKILTHITLISGKYYHLLLYSH